MMKAGLLKLEHDDRDFNLGAVFGVEKDLPEEFLVSGADKLKMKNQGGSDLCSAYATMTASELQENVELNPEFQFAFSKKISGNIEVWGQNLRDACKTAVEFGGLEQQDYLLNWKSKETTRDWKNWDSLFLLKAEPHKKKSYFRADFGIGATKFDLLKNAMYKHNSAIVSGIEWKYSECKNGIIAPNERQGMGHAITLIGWKIIDNYEYLIIHNSIGEDLGDRGLWYLPSYMIDELRYGNFIFTDLPKEKVKRYINNGILFSDHWIIKLYKIIKNFLCGK